MTKSKRTATVAFGLALLTALTLTSPQALAGENAAAGAGQAGGVEVLSSNSYLRAFLCFRTPVAIDKEGKTGTPADPNSKEGKPIAEFASPLPAADWIKPEFDDSAWDREVAPVEVDRGGASGRSHAARHTATASSVICLRSRFFVEDPAKVTDLKLTLKYVGGVVVYVNGQEAARADLPEGEIKPDTLAVKYPDDLYCEPEGAFLQNVKKNPAGFERRYRTLAGASIPSKLLRKGANVLALELHRSPVNGAAIEAKRTPEGGMYVVPGIWAYVGLRELSLTAAAGSAIAPNVERPKGVQVWNCSPYETVTCFEHGGHGLVTKIKPLGGTEISFGYDALLRRVHMTQGAVSTYFRHDGIDLLEVADTSGNLTKLTHGYRVIDGIGSVVEIEVNGTTYFLHQDHRGTTYLITDIDGNVVWRGPTNAWGLPISETGSNPSIFWYQGEAWWKVTVNGRLYYLSPARIYDAQDGRFVERGLRDGTDRNLYAPFGSASNPTNKADASGAGTSIDAVDSQNAIIIPKDPFSSKPLLTPPSIKDQLPAEPSRGVPHAPTTVYGWSDDDPIFYGRRVSQGWWLLEFGQVYVQDVRAWRPPFEKPERAFMDMTLKMPSDKCCKAGWVQAVRRTRVAGGKVIDVGPGEIGTGDRSQLFHKSKSWYADFGNYAESPFYGVPEWTKSIGKSPSLADTPGLGEGERFEALAAACCMEGALKSHWVAVVHWGFRNRGQKHPAIWNVALGPTKVPAEFRTAVKSGLEVISGNLKRRPYPGAFKEGDLPCSVDT